ncbi:MAG: hypothetical protein ACRD2J_01035 [Thermoanaerobaculia bacterium]
MYVRRLVLVLLHLGLSGCLSSSALEPFDPFLLSFGDSKHDVIASIEERGHRPLSLDARSVLIEGPVLPDVYENQREVLRFDAAGNLKGIHVQIEPEPGARGRDLLRLTDEVRKRLVERLGRPTWERREGTAGPGEIVYAFAEGDLVRTTEWHQAGRFVRAGIPRSMSGRLVVEIVVTPTPIERGEAFWGIETDGISRHGGA